MIYENSDLDENECDEDSFDSDYEDEMFITNKFIATACSFWSAFYFLTN
jgi:hypothetical protein